MSEQQARILIAEDEANLRLVLQKELERLGYRVQAAPDGEAALRKLEESNVDVLLCDINMPRIDGIEALRQIRAHDATRAIPIVAVTASAMDRDRQQIMAAGFDAYQSKPLNVKEFMAAVEAILAR